ncbi:hypothetical protein MCM47_28745 [Kitasatospora sp. A2-31]|nr:hypothetical protein [Kitasatospora sp. A2-31]
MMVTGTCRLFGHEAGLALAAPVGAEAGEEEVQVADVVADQDCSVRTKDGAVRLSAADLGGPLGERATLVQFSTAFCQPCRATVSGAAWGRMGHDGSAGRSAGGVRSGGVPGGPGLRAGRPGRARRRKLLASSDH